MNKKENFTIWEWIIASDTSREDGLKEIIQLSSTNQYGKYKYYYTWGKYTDHDWEWHIVRDWEGEFSSFKNIYKFNKRKIPFNVNEVEEKYINNYLWISQ